MRDKARRIPHPNSISFGRISRFKMLAVQVNVMTARYDVAPLVVSSSQKGCRRLCRNIFRK